ncbi:hypothetical protein W02_16870 [Nitrospira sp. KM1]|nr:hypothetical protein W02_16870 [Nitrospira sp. KM1]
MVAAVCGLILGAWYLSDALHWGADYASRTGETRAVSLTDGSTVELNTNSAIKIALTPEKRQITLLAGEAFFAVAPDPQRPFQVIVGQGTIQALGTAFNVRVDAHQTTISVSEHSVQVTSAGQSNSRELSQGNRVRMGDDGKISAVEPYNEQRDLAWRRHRLIFEHQPLTEVLAEMSRYRQGFIIPMDNKLSEETITGVFDTTRIDEALNTIESGLHVKLIRITDRLVLLFSPP